VSWVIPDRAHSEHPSARVTDGQSYVTGLINAVMSGPNWNDTVIFLAWDDWGGFYDHVVPPAGRPPGDTPKYRTWGSDPASQDFAFDRLGVRVPAVLVSPFTERGAFDHTPREHSTVVKALHELFGISTLTVRGDHAPSISHLFRRAHPRQDAPTQLPDVFGSEADD